MEKVGFEQVPAPWAAFPWLDPIDVGTHLKQGACEPWFHNKWIPFWRSLNDAQKEAYLDHWRATPEWRSAIGFLFTDDAEFDAEADYRESEQWLQQRREERAKAERQVWWRRIFRGGDR